MQRSKQEEAASEQASLGLRGGKKWSRPTVSLLAASSAEAGGSPIVDGGDTMS